MNTETTTECSIEMANAIESVGSDLAFALVICVILWIVFK